MYKTKDRIILEVKGEILLGRVYLAAKEYLYIILDNNSKIKIRRSSSKILGHAVGRLNKQPISKNDINKWLISNTDLYSYAISDIHGCYTTFLKLLSQLKNIRHLYLLGDYVDRGPKSKEVITKLMQMRNITCLLGNHEQMMLQALKNERLYYHWFNQGGRETLESFGSELKEIPSKYINWIKKLKPFAIHNTNFVLVHGGMNLHMPGAFKKTEENVEQMVWNRDAYVQDDSPRKLVVGHTPCSLATIERSLSSNKIMIDGGCVYDRYGYLVALNLDTLEITTQKNVD